MKIYNLKKQEGYLLPLFTINIEEDGKIAVFPNGKGLKIDNSYAQYVENILDAEGIRVRITVNDITTTFQLVNENYEFVMPLVNGPVEKINTHQVQVCEYFDGDVEVTTNEGYEAYSSDNITGI